MMDQRNTLTTEEWRAEGERRFGPDMMTWAFVCPACGNVATVQQFKDAGATSPEAAARNCIGRYLPETIGFMPSDPAEQRKRKQEPDGKPCDWTANGLLGTLGKGITVELEGANTISVFQFADATRAIVPAPTEAAGAARDGGE